MQTCGCAPRPTLTCAVVLALAATGAAASPAVPDSLRTIVTAAGQAPPRDRVPPPRTGTGVVKGRVVDGTTGAGIARARIMMQGMGAGSPVLTNADGGFSFTGLPPGPIMFSVNKSTYLPGRYPDGGRSMRTTLRPVALHDGEVLDKIVIPLYHGASISGRVLDADGDAVDFAQVSAMRLPAAGRAGKPVMRGSTQTNDLGEFRLGRLEAGTYIVQVTARRTGMDMVNPAAAPPPPSPEPVPTFYPAAVAIDQAQPIVLERSQAVAGIDVILVEGLPGVITGTVVTANGQPLPPNTFSNVMLRRVMGPDNPNSFDFVNAGATARPDGTFRATVPPGEYMLEARLMWRNGTGASDEEQFGTTRVSVVSGGEESVTLVVGRGASAAGRIVFEGTSPVPPAPGKVRIPMFSENGMCRGGEAVVAPDWSFRADSLIGTCSLQPGGGSFGRWMLKAVIVNGENVVDSPMTFQPGQQLRNVQVVVTDRRSEITFQVADENGQTTRDYVVLAYPVEKSRWPMAVRTSIGQSTLDLSGTRGASGLPGQPAAQPSRPSAFPDLRPGDYYVIAVDDMEPEDPRDPAVLEQLRSSATRVTVTEGSSAPVSLRRLNFSDLMRQK